MEGALIKGLAEVGPLLSAIRVDKRIARRHYGTSALAKFSRDKHDPMRRYKA